MQTFSFQILVVIDTVDIVRCKSVGLYLILIPKNFIDTFLIGGLKI